MTDVELRRSTLVTPASEPDMMAKAAGTAADAVVFDLEDAVAPAEKPAARDAVVDAARDHDWRGTRLSYRINGLDTRWWYEDVIDVVTAAGDAVDSVVVPKVSRPADVHAVVTLLSQVEANAGVDAGRVGLELLVEGPEGLCNAAGIAAASDRTDALVFGPGDYAAATGVPGLDVGRAPAYPGHYWHAPLSRLNAAAKAAGVRCLDGPVADIEDAAAFRTAAEHANALGCDGKWAVHPSQIDVANGVFAPDRAVAERARRIVDAYAEATASGDGAVSVDGRMVDEATHRMAKEVLARAEAAGVL